MELGAFKSYGVLQVLQLRAHTEATAAAAEVYLYDLHINSGSLHKITQLVREA